MRLSSNHFKQLIIYSVGGFLATMPMTIWMLGMNRLIPTPEPDPLPPEEITVNLIAQAKVDHKLTHTQKKGMSLINHFLYGALVALPFGLFRREHLNQPMVQGMGYGLLVWVSNYLGLLPALNIYPAATQEPARMNGVMITAHLIWGGTLGWFSNRFSRGLA